MSETSASPVTPPFGETYKVYRPGQVALCAQAVRIADESKSFSLNLELARGVAGGFLWQDKQVIQVSRHELPSFCACLLGFLLTMKGMYHGPNKNKGYALEHKVTGLELSLFQPGKRWFITLDSPERFWLTEFALHQLSLNSHTSSKFDLMEMLRRSFFQPKNN